jgi:asparagine synthase (glutamine-hydrolysing)
MCGIFGYVSLDSEMPDSLQLQSALTALSHRGPDESGFYHSDNIFLGMRRLSIIDLAGGNQPIWNEDRSACIVYNGELYNYQDLRPELISRGHIFRTHSDTEVILHSYEEWGTECLARFNGMFAFAIWDQNRHQLFVARDRIGEKPLYYFWGPKQFAFGSEIKALVAIAAIPRSVNPVGLVNYFSSGHAVAPETMFAGISKLLPGHYLVLRDGRVTIHEYWGRPEQIEPSDQFSEADFEHQIIELLDDSVKRRMLADVPLGAFLSGGVDSSTVVALMKRHASGPVKTFSLGFSVGGAYNELSEASAVARVLGTEHHEMLVDVEQLTDTLQTLVYHYDEPFGDAAGFPIYLLSKYARDSVKVVLTGDGGDELFGGYRRYMADQWHSVYRLLPGKLRRSVLPHLAEQLPRFRRVKKAVSTLSIDEPSARYASWLATFTPAMLMRLILPDVFARVGEYDARSVYFKHYYEKHTLNDDHLNRLMYIDIKTLLADGYLEKMDKATMAAGLEARVPFLDHRLVELSFRIPSRFKIKGSTTKAILKQAVRSLIPAEVLQRPKHGFAVPTDPWFRGALRQFSLEVLTDPGAKYTAYLDKAYVQQLWHEHERGRHVWDSQLWLLLNFELWHRIYI